MQLECLCTMVWQDILKIGAVLDARRDAQGNARTIPEHWSVAMDAMCEFERGEFANGIPRQRSSIDYYFTNQGIHYSRGYISRFSEFGAFLAGLGLHPSSKEYAAAKKVVGESILYHYL